MQMNANQLTKIPVEKLSDTLRFLIAENEIPLSDAFKQVIDDVDAVCKKLLRDESAPAQPVIPEQAKPEFYTKPDRFLPECLKPEDISGESRNSRIAELMGWFDRYYNGKANPKWLKPHVAELCYYILTVPQLSAQPVSEPYKSAANDIIAERQRQISAEGWTPEHDDEHDKGELALAAVCYINETGTVNRNGGKPWGCPWDASWWKPDTRRRNLIKAGALILAEIERLDRAATAQESE